MIRKEIGLKSESLEAKLRNCGYYPEKKILEKGDYGCEAEYCPRKGTCLVWFGLGEASLGLWPVPELAPGWQVGGKAAEKQITSSCAVRTWPTALKAERQEEQVIKKMDPQPHCQASDPSSAIHLLCQLKRVA